MRQDFGTWLDTRTLRRSGKRLAASSLVGHVNRVRQAARLMGHDVEDSPGIIKFAQALTARADVDHLLDVLYARHAASTVRVDVQSLRLFGEYAVAQGYIAACALTADDVPAHAQSVVSTYSAAEVERLLLFAEARSLRFFMLVATVYETGCRIGEVLDLEWSGTHLDVVVPHFDLTKTKTGKQRLVPLSRRLREDVWTPANVLALREGYTRAKKSPAYVFRQSYESAHQSLTRTCERAGLEAVGWHRLRHTRATQLLAAGTPIHAVAKLLGHASVQTTERVYDHTTSLDVARYLD